MGEDQMPDQMGLPDTRPGDEAPALARAAARAIDSRLLIAAAAIFIGWFLLDTVSMSYGALRLDFRFYHLAAIIGRPTRLLTGIDGAGEVWSMLFSLVCLASLAAALVPGWLRLPVGWLGCLAPLVLMLVCGGALYYETSRETFAVATSSNVTNALTSFANLMVRRVGAVVARQVRVDAGAWLSAAGAIYLAWLGWRRAAV
jgi:hypothetical protein